MKTTYDRLRAALRDIKGDLDILAGKEIGPSNATWQDVAGTCAVNLRELARLLDAARVGDAEPFLVFPVWEDA